MADLTSKTIRGLKWTYTATVTNAVLQIGFAALLARLLEPRAFGIIAMANVVLQFGNFFAQMGVGRALIQKKSISQGEIRASFTSSLFLSVFMAGLAYFTAPLAGLYYQNTEVVPVLRVMALSYILSGLSATSLSLLRRDLAFKSTSVVEIISYVIGYGLIGVLAAWRGFGVWSLVLAALSQLGISMILYYLFARHSLRLTFRWQHFKPLYAFGSKVSVISVFEFIGFNLDTLLIGRLFSASSLGLYDRAYKLIRQPMYQFATSFSKVLFPSFSKLQEDKARLKNAYLMTIALSASFIIPACFGMAAAGKELILVLLGEQWQEAIPIFQILAFAMPANLLTHFSGVACEALAKLKEKFILQVSYIVVLSVAFFIARPFGLPGIAAALAVSEFLRHSAYMVLTGRILGISRKEFLASYLPPVQAGVFTFVAIYLVASAMRSLAAPLAVTFLLEALTGALSLLVLALYGPLKPLARLGVEKVFARQEPTKPLIRRLINLLS